jgi:hypothetical protein
MVLGSGSVIPAYLRLQLPHQRLGQAQASREVPLDALGGFRAAVACNATGMWPLARIGDCRFADSEALLGQLRHALAQTPWQPL